MIIIIVSRKWNRKTKEWIISDADIIALGRGKDVDVYTTFDKSGNGVRVNMWVDRKGEEDVLTAKGINDQKTIPKN